MNFYEWAIVQIGHFEGSYQVSKTNLYHMTPLFYVRDKRTNQPKL